MNEQGVTLNESIQLHEILTFKNLCLTKSITMSPLVSDNELKTILQQEVAVSKQHIEELRELMERCNITTLKNIGS
jgi:similar to spore coat protein